MATIHSATSLSYQHRAPRVLGIPEPWFFLGVGAVTAPIFALTPILSYMGWFLGSLVHEMGHTAVAWFFGIPSFPAIRLDGHAATVHEQPVRLFAGVIWVALCAGAWRLFHGHAGVRWGALAVVLVGYPLLALTSAREVLVLLGGHATELAIAAVFLWRGLSGGFTSSPVERGLFATVGWHLLGANLILSVGLVFSDAARDAYRGNGSFGITNDYIRVANGFADGSVPFVAGIMTLVGLCVLPATYAAYRVYSAE